jgi:hypothetical protein
LDNARITGRSLISLIASTTCWVKAPPMVLTPMIVVGLMLVIASTKSVVGECGCA